MSVSVSDFSLPVICKMCKLALADLTDCRYSSGWKPVS